MIFIGFVFNFPLCMSTRCCDLQLDDDSLVGKSGNPFTFGPARLLHLQRLVQSSDWRRRFEPHFHDAMCCDEEWQFRLNQRLDGVTRNSPPAELELARCNAYSDSEKIREVKALTPFTRSIIGLRDTLNHILRRFFDISSDDEMLRCFSSVVYPTLRQANVDLQKPANAAASAHHCAALHRSIRFLIQMFCITHSAAAEGDFLREKCITIAKQLLQCVYPAWNHI
jgi:hypothetical protein